MEVVLLSRNYAPKFYCRLTGPSGEIILCRDQVSIGSRGKPRHEWWSLPRKWLPLALGRTYDAVCGMKISAPAGAVFLTQPSLGPYLSQAPMIDSEVMHRPTWKPRPDVGPVSGTWWQLSSFYGQSLLFSSAELSTPPMIFGNLRLSLCGLCP